MLRADGRIRVVEFVCALGILGSMVTDASAGEWTWNDNGKFITAENGLYKVRFAYGGSAEGFFVGNSSTNGGRDGAIVELYYKPTSTTRNMLFRNGTWGGGYDALDTWEAEQTALCQQSSSTCATKDSFNAPDYHANIHGSVVAHAVRESAGRLLVDFTVNFKAWQIKRHYLLYPWGKITTSAELKVLSSGYWNYIGRRFNVAGSRYDFYNGTTQKTYSWGTNLQADGNGYLRAWTDGVDRKTGLPVGASPLNFEDKQRVCYNYSSSQDTSTNCAYGDQNTTAHVRFNRPDTWSGFWTDSATGYDPDVMVLNGDVDDWNAPPSRIAREVAKHSSSKLNGLSSYLSYVELAEYSHSWAPRNEIQLGLMWVYMTTGGGSMNHCNSDPNCLWNKRGYWSTGLNSGNPWVEAFHVYLMPPKEFTTSDYLPLWWEGANQLPNEQPTLLTSGASVRLDPIDKLYHVSAPSGGKEVKFSWKRAKSHPAGRSINYRTAFVAEGLTNPTVAVKDANGGTPSNVNIYPDGSGETVILLNVTQPSTPLAYTVTVTGTPIGVQAQAEPTPPSDPVGTSPTVAITSPVDGATVSDTVTVEATASDADGIRVVEFFLDGGLLLGADPTAPYTLAWNTTGLANGLHSLSSRVSDTAGNTALSPVVTVTVSNAKPDLVTWGISGPTTGYRGKTISVWHKVKNGSSVGVGAFAIGIYLSTNNVISTSDTRIGTRSVSSLAAGAYSEATVSVTVPSTLSTGTYYLGQIADYDSKVAEASEDNNTQPSSSSIAIK